MEQGEKQERSTWLVSLVSILFIIGIFAVASLFLINIGVQVYRNVVTANDENFDLRTSLSYIATRVRQNDRENAVYLKEHEGVQVLVLEEELDGAWYQTLIYHYDGYVREHFMEKDGYFELSFGIETFEIAEFCMEETADGMLCVTASNRAGASESLSLGLRSDRSVTE
ncbi:MAG: DUF4860 domain-containing protein [Lachnospiraceae bacterium]|nr:DUF4860 domain-containing protein [Lachnospiraceae bacterium]